MKAKGLVAMATGMAMFLALSFWGSPPVNEVIPQGDGVVKAFPSYAEDIQPFFNELCTVCHSPPNPPAGVNLTTYYGVMQGSSFGPMVIPEQPEMSNLLMHLKREVDPGLWKLCDLEGVSPGSPQVKNLERWILQGADFN